MGNIGYNQSIYNDVEYSDLSSSPATVTVTLGKIPKNAIPLNCHCDVETKFNSGGTDIITIGTADDPDKFVASIDVSSTGRKALTLLDMQEPLSTTEDTEIVAVYTSTGTAPTTGKAHVTLEFSMTS